MGDYGCGDRIKGAGASGISADAGVTVEPPSTVEGIRTILGPALSPPPAVVPGGADTVAPSRLTGTVATPLGATQLFPDLGCVDPLRLS